MNTWTGPAVIFVYVFLPLILGLLQIGFQRIKTGKWALIFDYYVFIAVGLQGLISGIVQTMNPAFVADFVQWDNSPFIVEVGMANLAFGIIGIVSPWRDFSWRAATATGYSVFLVLTGIWHVANILYQGPTPGHYGHFVLTDLLIPIPLLVFLFLASLSNRYRAQ
jgi:hypothetical protein